MATKKPKISIYLESDEQKQALEEWCHEEKRSISNLVSFLIDQALKKRTLTKDSDRKMSN
jgi:hypothetical protein